MLSNKRLCSTHSTTSTIHYEITIVITWNIFLTWQGVHILMVLNGHSNRCAWLNFTPNKQKNISLLFSLITFPMERRSSLGVFVFSKQWLIILQPPLLQVFKTLEFQWPKCFICGAVCREVLLSHQTSIFQGKYQI